MKVVFTLLVLYSFINFTISDVSGQSAHIRKNRQRLNYVARAASSINEKDAYYIVRILSARTFKGRDAIEDTYETAANIMAWQLEELGYQPFPGDVGMLQHFYIGQKMSCNVIGFLPARSDQYIIIGAHLDHIGTVSDRFRHLYPPEQDYYPGADDNASGVAAVYANAKAFAILHRKNLLKKNIVIIFWGSEERYLDGSDYFVKKIESGTYLSEGISMKSFSLVINYDMVGRRYEHDESYEGGNKTALLIGSIDTSSYKQYEKKNPVLALIISAKSRTDPKLILIFDDSIDYNGLKSKNRDTAIRSDSMHFLKRDIATLFFCGPEHADYHTPSDTYNLIDFDRLARIAKLGFYITAEVATTNLKPICYACGK